VLRDLRDFLGQWGKQAKQDFLARWEYRVLWVLLVLPVLLVLLAVVAQLDPQVRQALWDWLRPWFSKAS
jgi:hypothetical protein